MPDKNRSKSKHRHHHHHHKGHFHLTGKKITFFVLLICCVGVAWTLYSQGKIQREFFQRSLASLDLAEFANTDYRLDSALPNPSKNTRARYPHLRHGVLKWQEVPFQIPVSYTLNKEWSVYTSCNNSNRSVEIPLIEKPSQAVYLLVDGCNFKSKTIQPLAELTIAYEDGSWEKTTLQANRDIYPFDEKGFGLSILPDQVVWMGGGSQSLSGLRIPLNPKKTPKSLEINTLGKSQDSGIILFAAVQEKKHWLV
jgi:hypothetical protein